MSHPILKATLDLGQSIWLDFVSRRLLNSGELDRLITEGVRGLTSNPTIFEQAIGGSADYDEDIEQGIRSGWDAARIFEHLAVRDVGHAADALRRVYEESAGADGYVSLEVSPKLAHDTAGTVVEAKRLWASVGKPNLMIKVPGTREGLPAVRALLGEGINVNVTLIFSLRQYADVLDAYLLALEDRVGRGKEVSRVASVASLFVSRVDSAADKLLAQTGRPELQAKAAVANACLAFRHFREVTAGARWKALAARGARVQRPLWASTSTKNPAYSDILYVQELLGPGTVNTVPPVTLAAWKDHGTGEPRLLRNLEHAEQLLSRIRSAGVDIDRITEDLIEDGVVKFAASYDTVLAAIESKMHSRVSA